MRLHNFFNLNEAERNDVNFDANDIKRLEGINDLNELKKQAFSLITKNSDRPMKPAKVSWFKRALISKTNKMAVIKMMYDLMLSGEGHSVIGTATSTAPNSYRANFGEGEGDAAVSTVTPKVAEDTKIAYLGYEILNATTKLCTYIDKTPHLWEELIDGMDSGKHMDYLMKKLGIGFNELRKFEEVFEVTPGVEWDFYEWPLAWKEGEWDATVIQPWKNYARKVLKARGAINPPKKLMNSEMSEGEGDAAVGYGPYDRGVADGYYGRQPKPHKYVTNAEGKRIPVKLTDPREIAAYMAGFNDDSFGSKDYSENVDLNELSKDTLKRYVPARLASASDLKHTNIKKAQRIVSEPDGDIRRAMNKLRDPKYGKAGK
jgi:hypothetical protein